MLNSEDLWRLGIEIKWNNCKHIAHSMVDAKSAWLVYRDFSFKILDEAQEGMHIEDGSPFSQDLSLHFGTALT